MTDDPGVNAAPKALVRSKVVTKPMIAQVYGSMSLTRKVSRVSDILGITTLECTIECFTLLGGGKIPYMF